MYDPYQITPQLQQPVQQQPQLAPGTMNPNLNPDDEAVKRQKMMMMAEALRGMQQPASAPAGSGGVTSAAGNPLGSAVSGFTNVYGLGSKMGAT